MDQLEVQKTVIPSPASAKSFGQFLKDRLALIKTHSSTETFLTKINQIGIKSRATYNQILRGKRRFPVNRMSSLVNALDLTFNEKVAVQSILVESKGATANSSFDYVDGNTEVLSSPLNTIVLNLCSLKNKLTKNDLHTLLNPLFSNIEIEQSIELLLKKDLLETDAQNTLRRVADGYQLSTPPGVKLDYVKKYIQTSLKMAERNYDLPLESREYSSFTTKISKDDFLKLKDLVRDFRKNVYGYSKSSDCDSIVHVNINAFIVSTNSNQLS